MIAKPTVKCESCGQNWYVVILHKLTVCQWCYMKGIGNINDQLHKPVETRGPEDSIS
jgi:protein-arginine kinase activator protein McsA